MAFLIYNRTEGPSGFRYEHVGPVKLAGTTGAIARHVAGLPSEQAADGWRLESGRIPTLMQLAAPNATPVVLMDLGSGQSDAVCIYELTNVFGTSRDKSTTLVMEFTVLFDGKVPGAAEQFRQCFEVPSGSPRHVLHETMELSGGTDGGDWRWSQPKMNIGATVVSPAHGWTSGGRKPAAV